MPGFVGAALDKAVTVPSGTIHAHVEKIRRRNPLATPAQVIAILEKEYLRVVATTGGAVGAAAATPSIGTGTAVALTAGDVAGFFGASAAFSLAVASVHGIDVQDVDRRKALLLATLLGEAGVRAVGDTAEIGAVHVARTLLTRMPLRTVKAVNNQLTRRIIRRQAAKQGGLALGRLAPFGIGAVIGIVGGRALGKTVVDGARAAFGPAPVTFPRILELPASPRQATLRPGLRPGTPPDPRPGPLPPGPTSAHDLPEL